MTRRLAALLVGSLAICVVSPVAAQIGPEIAEQFDCAACHTDRLREFRRRGATTLVEHDPRPKLDTGRQDESSSPDMCLSCHDGFVMDSRSLWQEGQHGHPVGMYPSDRITQPVVGDEAVFPMNDDGRMYCGTCHSPHYHGRATREAPPFMRVDLRTGNLCTVCHKEKKSVKDSDHAPPASRRRAPPDFSDRGLCTRCHVAHDAKAPVMWAREPGPGKTVADALCHSCHEGDVALFEHPNTIEALSHDLRADVVADRGEPMPVFDASGSRSLTGVIGCPTCHDAHFQRAEGLENDRSGLFLRRTRPERFMCADCHGPSALRRYQFYHSRVSRRR